MMVPIEIISHMARPLSLTIRLYANMFAGEKVTMAFLGLTLFPGARDFHGAARFRRDDTSLHFHGADHGVRRWRSGARALIPALCRLTV